MEENEESARALSTFSNNHQTHSAFVTVLKTNVEVAMKDEILFDNQAQSSIFGNANLLEDIQERATTVEYSGLNREATIKVTKCALYKGLRVDYYPDLDVNLISFSQAKEVCLGCRYMDDEDAFYRTLPHDNDPIEFHRKDGLYIHEVKKHVFTDTMEANEKNNTRDELKRMAEARRIKRDWVSRLPQD